jgi:outer membrane protein assembly factor BamE (lipoprotein component of BamABCDE complex)
MTLGIDQDKRRGLLRKTRFKLHGFAGLTKTALAGLALAVLVACTPLYTNHGYVPDDTALASITTGVDTRDTVAAFLGRPSVEGLIGDAEWFYVRSQWKTVGAKAPLEVDRQVLAITFDEQGVVTNIERFGLEKGEIVAISRRVTTEPIKGRNILAQIFGNIGRLDPAALLAK